MIPQDRLGDFYYLLGCCILYVKLYFFILFIQLLFLLAKD